MSRMRIVIGLAVAVGLAGLGASSAATAGPATPNAGVAAPAGGSKIAVSDAAACVVAANGTVRCWGSNFFGLVDPTSSQKSFAVPQTVKGVTGATAIAMSSTACVVLRDGRVECWGDNADGEHGDGTYGGSLAPTFVHGITTAVGIEVSNHVCALLRNGTVDCWGNGANGALGTNTIETNLPNPVLGLANVTAITGDGVTCALLRDQTARCWGLNASGALGDGSHVVFSATPVAVKGLHGVVSLASAGYTSCAAEANGRVVCWGSDASGQLGIGLVTDGAHRVPVQVRSISNARSVSESGSSSCAVLTTTGVECWGSGAFGELGNGKQHTALGPVPVTGLHGAVVVSLGVDSACALLTDASARCWGDNQSGELGNGSHQGSNVPVVVKNIP